MELKICHLYPDVLNLYGDGGNILCLQKRLAWRGIDVSVARLPIGSTESLAGFDLVFIGGGQDFEQQVLLEDLHRGRDRELLAAVDDGITILAICGGYQMLGAYYETLVTALEAQDRPVYIIPTYTAMLELREVLVRHCGGDEFWV